MAVDIPPGLKPRVEDWYVMHRILPAFPVIIERPRLQHGGSNVLFWDGRVEFIRYPGKWPMTEKFIKALKLLDALKVKE